MDEPDGQCLGLAPIQLADKPLFDRAFAHLPQRISDYTFAATYMWTDSLHLSWAPIERHLCVFANTTGDLTMLMPPIPQLGATDADLTRCIDACFDIMDRYNDRASDRSHSRIEYVSDAMLEQFSAMPNISLSATASHSDYVYDCQRMIDLAGGPLKSKRHARSKFQRDFPDHRAEPLNASHIPACRALAEQWAIHGDAAHEGEVNDAHQGSDILRHRELTATCLALDAFEPLQLRGMVLFVGEKLIGFTLGEPLDATQASILVEKTDPAYPGAAQLIFSEFCRQAWADHPLINAGDDWGLPSLRFAKQSYRPMRTLCKYILTRQPTLLIAGMPVTDLPVENPAHLVADRPLNSPTHPIPSTIDIRRAVTADTPGIEYLEQICFSQNVEAFNRRQIRRLIANPRATVTVAEADGQVLGWAVGLIRQHHKGRSGRIYAIAVHPDVRGRHVGQQLAQQTIHELAQRGALRTYLEVRVDNLPAIRLYRKLGFVDDRPIPNYYGIGCHALHMRRAAVALSDKHAHACTAIPRTLGQSLPRERSAVG